jgi:hypothetical protein
VKRGLNGWQKELGRLKGLQCSGVFIMSATNRLLTFRLEFYWETGEVGKRTLTGAAKSMLLEVISLPSSPPLSVAKS